MLSIAINLLLAIHVIVSLLIVLVVLMQRPKSEGLGAAFGGGMMDSLVGVGTTTFLQKVTRWLGGLFLGLTLILSMLYAKQANVGAKTDIQRQLTSVPAPAPALPKASASPSSAAFTPAPDGVLPLASATPVNPLIGGTSVATPAPVLESTPAASVAPVASATPAAPDQKKDGKAH